MLVEVKEEKLVGEPFAPNPQPPTPLLNSVNDVNVTLPLPRNSDSWSAMLVVSEEAFIVNLGGGDDVSTWLEGTPGHIIEFYFFKTWWEV